MASWSASCSTNARVHQPGSSMLALRVTRTMTADSVALATASSEIDASWGATVAPIADGWAVLCGPDMFVNRLEGAGIDEPLDAEHLDQFERLAQLVGVAPAVALPDFAESANRSLLLASGYRPDSAVSVSTMSLDDVASIEVGHLFTLETVTTEDTLSEWQRAAALGWGHHHATGRRASDAFALAAAAAPGSSLMLVRDASSGGVVATCGLTIRDGMATLGGMSVLPTERRRGVQAASIGRRLAIAQELGCDLAVTSTVVGGDSERNVARCGFRLSHAVTTWRKSARRKSV